MDQKEIRELAADGNVQASVLLAVGPSVWKFISNISNVDFLLGLNGEKFHMFLSFLQGPGWIVLTLVGIFWLIVRVVYRPYLPLRHGPTWSLLASAATVAFLFGILVAVQSTGSVPIDLIAGYGSTDPRTCVTNVKMDRLASFAKDYKFAVVCGIQDNTKDRLEQDDVTISNRFTITMGVQQVVWPIGSAMSQRVAALSKAAQEASGNPNAGVAYQTWHTVVLLPNEIPTSKVTKLADVLTLGGKILDGQYFR